jgi:pyruvate dehydrogenase E1 component alpha subunit
MTSASTSPLDFASSPINQSLTAERKIELYTQMVRIRRFEQAALKYYQGRENGGFLHLYIGQEASRSARSRSAARRSLHHRLSRPRPRLAVGMGMNECMAEMFGKQTGCSKGKGGSMHFFAPDKNFWGGHGIVAGQTPLGLGLAYGLKYLGREGCCLCFLGDGAVNQGAFHESLNLAALFDIPVVLSSKTTATRWAPPRNAPPPTTAASPSAPKPTAWSGMSSTAPTFTKSAPKPTSRWSAPARNTSPPLLEIDTYRYYGHSVADANHKKYRTPEEIEDYKQNHDPISVFRRKLIAEGVLTEDSAAAINKAAAEEAAASVKFAEESPAPTIADISTDVYWETDNDTPASRKSAAISSTTEPRPQRSRPTPIHSQDSPCPALSPTVKPSAKASMRNSPAIRTSSSWARKSPNTTAPTRSPKASGKNGATSASSIPRSPKPAFIGMGIGASMLGVRPVMELMFWSFHSVAFDQLVNNAACVRYMSGGLCNCPIVVRGPANGGTGVGATHSHIPEGLFAAFPASRFARPPLRPMPKASSRPPSATTIRSTSWKTPCSTAIPAKSRIPADGDFVIPLGKADLKREGSDVSLIAHGRSVIHALAAAEDAPKSEHGISCRGPRPPLHPSARRGCHPQIRDENQPGGSGR